MSLQQENCRLQFELATLKQQLAEKNMEEDVLKLDEGMVAFYTGLPNYEILKAVYDLVEPGVHHTSRNCLPKFQEMVVFLMRLRLNLHLEDIAYRYYFLIIFACTTFFVLLLRCSAHFCYFHHWNGNYLKLECLWLRSFLGTFSI